MAANPNTATSERAGLSAISVCTAEIAAESGRPCMLLLVSRTTAMLRGTRFRAIGVRCAMTGTPFSVTCTS